MRKMKDQVKQCKWSAHTHTSKAKKRNDDDNDVGLNEHTKCIIPPINVNTIMLLYAHFGQIAIEFQSKVD